MLSFSKATFPKCSHFPSIVSVTAMCPASLPSCVTVQGSVPLQEARKEENSHNFISPPNYPYYAKKPRGKYSDYIVIIMFSNSDHFLNNLLNKKS